MSPRVARKAFTLVELLVVIGIIAVLAGLLIVGVGAATRRAQLANTRFLLTSMVQAMAAFKADHGYYPPVLGDPGMLPGVLGWGYSGGGPIRSTGPAAAGQSLWPNGQVGWQRDLLTPPVKTAPLGGDGTPSKGSQWTARADIDGLQRWHSVTTAAEYLIGAGDRSADGHGICGTLPETPIANPAAGQREVPREGIRSPGIDGVWGAALTPRRAGDLAGTSGGTAPYQGMSLFAPNRNVGTYGMRNLAVPSRARVDATANSTGNDDSTAPLRFQPNLQGKVYGPYLELKDPSTLGGIRGIRADGEYDVVRATEGDPNFDVYPKCIVDYWGTPIRYYRKGYVNLTPSAPDTSRDGTAFDLGDFFALRPSRVDEADLVGDEAENLPDPAGDRTVTRRLRGAEIAFMSAGPDRRVDTTLRVGRSGPSKLNFNEDNIVETGP